MISPLERGKGLKENAQRSSSAEGWVQVAERCTCHKNQFTAMHRELSNTPLTVPLNASPSVSS